MKYLITTLCLLIGLFSSAAQASVLLCNLSAFNPSLNVYKTAELELPSNDEAYAITEVVIQSEGEDHSIIAKATAMVSAPYEALNLEITDTKSGFKATTGDSIFSGLDQKTVSLTTPDLKDFELTCKIQ